MFDFIVTLPTAVSAAFEIDFFTFIILFEMDWAANPQRSITTSLSIPCRTLGRFTGLDAIDVSLQYVRLTPYSDSSIRIPLGANFS